MSIPHLCASTFRRARSPLGISLSFSCTSFAGVKDAVDGPNAVHAEYVYADVAERALSWFVVVDRNERVPAADVLPGLGAS